MKTKKMSIFLSILILFTFILSPTSFAAKYNPPFDPDAQGIYLVNLDTDEVIYEKNAHEKMYPASTTKIMTAILALEMVDSPETAEVTMKPYVENAMYIKNKENNWQLTLGGFVQKEVITMEKLLYSVLLPSANEAAMMVADYVGDGSVDYFIELMNNKAKELGALDTHFTNPHGLHDPEHYTTPYDMYLIAKYAMQNPTFAKIVSTVSFEGGPTNKHESLLWHTSNSMIKKDSKYYAPYIKGVKTGTTNEAGRCLISIASKDGYNYMMVLLGGTLTRDDGEISSFFETKNIYEWVFNTFKVKTIMEKGEILGETKLRLANDKKDHLKLMSGERLTALVPDEIDITSVTVTMETPKSVNAPVKKGDLIGYANFVLAGEDLGKVPLISAENIEVSTIKYYLDEIFKISKTFWFKFVIVFLLLLVISYPILAIMHNKKNRYK